MQTTIGQILVNEALPEEFRDDTRVLTKGEADKLLESIARKYPDKYREISHGLMQLGAHASFEEGTTLRLSDLRPVVDKTDMLKHIAAEERKIRKDKDLTDDERQAAIDHLYGESHKALTNMTVEGAAAIGNPFALQVKSKARGKPVQLAALMTTPGVYQDAQDRTIPVFIRHSYAEGLDPHEYWAATYGARKGLLSTKFCLAYDTLVRMVDFSVKRICDIVPGDVVFSADPLHGDRLVPTTVSAVCRNGPRLCNRYVIRHGKSQTFVQVDMTDDHKLYVEDPKFRKSEVTAKCFASLGLRLSAVKPSVFEPLAPVHEPHAFLIGALLGDGGLSGHNTNLSCPDGKGVYAQSMKEAFGTNITLKRLNRAESGVDNYLVTEVESSVGIGGGHKTPFRTRLAQLGMLGKLAPQKVVPNEVLHLWDLDSVVRFVCGIIETDGSVTTVSNGKRKYPVVTVSVTSRELVEGLRQLLELRLGIASAPIHTQAQAGATYVFKTASGTRIGTCNYDMHGFQISCLSELRAFCSLIPAAVTSPKIALLKVMVSDGYRTQTRFSRRVHQVIPLGLVDTYDLEVEHPTHRFVLANGLIVSNSVRQAGYLGKLLGASVLDTVVTESDCGTPYGLPVEANDKDNVGAVLARQAGKFPAGTVISKEVLAGLEKAGVDKVVLRSPITCALPQGICKQCAGQREDGKFPEIGNHLGLNASSALAERLAQASLNVKHTGMKDSAGGRVYAGFDVIKNLATVPKTFPDRAAVAELDGRVDDITPAPQGGTNITIDGQTHYVAPELPVTVKVGDKVEAGDQLSDGVLNPADAVRLKGIGEGRRYFVERFTKAFRDSDYPANRRNVEVLARSMVNHVTVDDQDGVGSALPGDVVTYSSVAQNYKPRPNSAMTHVKKAVGQYLEEPALHYTIGTRITKQVSDSLQKYGIDSALVHPNPPGFSPSMVSVVKVPEYSEDWMARLGSSYLQKRLLEDVQSGAEAHPHSLNPIPGIATGVEFGRPKGKKFTY